MLFGLGLATYGAARLLAGRGGGLVWTVCGVVLAGAIRPHVAAMFMIGLAVAWLLHPSTARSRLTDATVRIGIAIVVVIGAVLAIQRTQSFLQESGISTDAGISGVFTQTAERTGEGGSQFTPQTLDSPARIPGAFVTVLFRPVLIEGGGWQTIAAELEGTFLLILFLVRWRWVAAAFRIARRRSLLLLAAAFVVGFVIVYSPIANAGIMVRQRSQVMPFLLMVLAVPPLVVRLRRRTAR